MSVEQTTQLIQLILNSVLMVTASAFLLGGLLVRQSALETRLQTLNAEYLALPNSADRPGERLLSLKKQLRQLQQQAHTARLALIALHYGLVGFGGSTLVLTLRMVIDALWLIPFSLVLFALATVLLLAAILLALLEISSSDRPLWEDLKWVVSLNRRKRADSQGGLRQRLHPIPDIGKPGTPRTPQRARTRVVG